jgi:hypothetical protein
MPTVGNTLLLLLQTQTIQGFAYLNEPVARAVHAHVLGQQALVAAHISADDGLQPAEAQEAVSDVDLRV